MPVNVAYHTVGSWFPTGYYGHYRSRTRPDFINEYRQLAKPQPPKTFIQRAIQPASYHTFSLHDNRHSFPCDASYFSQGLGRKRHPERSGVFDPNVLSWTTHRANPKIDRPLTSTYRKDFRMGEPIVQKLVQRPQTSFDGMPTTTYRIVHGNESPNHNLINALNNEALVISSRNRQSQAKKKNLAHRETVASCLCWYRPRVPSATTYTEYQMDTQPMGIGMDNSDNLTSIASATNDNQVVNSTTESCSWPLHAVPE